MMLANRLRECRSRKGASLQTAADGIGCSKPHLWEMENGRTTNPTLDLLAGAARYFGTSVAFLIGETSTADAADELATARRAVKAAYDYFECRIGSVEAIERLNAYTDRYPVAPQSLAAKILAPTPSEGERG